MNITPNKLTIAQLFATPNEQFIVPPYQRKYAWGKNQYLALYDDINILKENDGHLLGMIILDTYYHTGGLNQPELVDGQQRMTTLIILLKAIEDSYRLKGKDEKANEIKKMLTCIDLDEQKKPKIKLGDTDDDDIECLLSKNDITDIININIKEAYMEYLKKLSTLEINQLNLFYYKLTNNAVIIRLDIGKAQDAYKLFETINNRGLRLTPTDIIKNFLLGHAAKMESKPILETVKKQWAEMLKYLDDIDTDDFLRQFICSILCRKVSMNQTVVEFKKYYKKIIIQSELLSDYVYEQDNQISEENENNENEDNADFFDRNDVNLIQKEKVDIVSFLNKLKVCAEIYRKITFATFKENKLNRHIRNLNNILSKTTYIFLMNFLKENNYSLNYKIEVLKYLETLMLRRHICGWPTGENDTIFAKMNIYLGSSEIIDAIKIFIDEGKYMPSDNEFASRFPNHEFKGKLINRAKYVLEFIEYFRRGSIDNLELTIASGEEVELEHIIPQTINTKKSKQEYGDWETYLGENKYN